MYSKVPSGWHAAPGNPEVNYIAMLYGSTSPVTAAMKSLGLWIGLVPG
jgi:hypothetical protein